jgi:hypothetical protein
MNLPPTNTNSAFERFLQELPQDYWDLAIEFKAFSRARKIQESGVVSSAPWCSPSGC